MGTAKRERQKANRQQRLQELAKQARHDKSKRIGLRIGIVLAAVIGLVAVVSFLGNDDDETTATTTIAPTSTLPTIPKPDVSLPEEEPTELKVTTVVEGTGEPATTGDTLQVHYVGVRWATGEEFENSYESGQPIPVTLGAGGVIAGWEQGLVGVQVGGRYQFDIPSDLAYGEGADEQVAGALIFVVDIMSITPAA